jgi:hypothetical protein
LTGIGEELGVELLEAARLEVSTVASGLLFGRAGEEPAELRGGRERGGGEAR